MAEVTVAEAGQRIARDFELNRFTEWLWRGLLAWMIFTTWQNDKVVAELTREGLRIDAFVEEQRELNRQSVELQATLVEVVAGLRRDIGDVEDDVDRLRGGR